MAGGCVYIKTLPDVELDPHGAELSYESAGEFYVRRYPRHLWRTFLEREIVRLNAYEAAEARKVISMRGRARQH